MGFYIRRGKNIGPLRLNLSKSGLGLSFGVTGARIGVNARGKAYVHGGRGGLYYRKQLGGAAGNRGTTRPLEDTVTLFIDTGVTTPDDTQPTQSLPPSAEKVPKMRAIGVKWLVILGVVFLSTSVAAFADGELGVGIVTALIVLGVLVLWGKQQRRQQQLYDTVDLLRSRYGSDFSLEAYRAVVPEKMQQRLLPFIFQDWCSFQIENQVPKATEAFMAAYPKIQRELKDIQMYLLDELVEAALLDHELTPEEEQSIQEFKTAWVLPDAFIQALADRLSFYRRLREWVATLRTASSQPLAFEAAGKLLKERVLNRYQRDRVPYREVGYAVDVEGIFFMNNTTFGLRQPSSTTRTYRISDIQDVMYMPHRGVLELTLKGRKSQLIVATNNNFQLVALLANMANQTT
ncbi:MAG: DUF4236 domain-containing protein [Schleiferiaceae bacterium]|nr:DUF4236 domain-containing protein [Schleiferiaceae bacterium]